jgi:hypothetical protein
MRHILLGLGMAVMLSACGDPLRNVTRLSDVNVDAGAARVAQTPADARNTGGGLFGRLLNRTPDDPTNAAVSAALAQASGETVTVPDPDAPNATSARRGLFGLFGGNRSDSTPTSDAPQVAETVEEAVVQPVAQVATTPPRTTAEAPRRGLAGLFRRSPDTSNARRTGPDLQDVGAGTVMPFGEIARVCDVRGAQLGRQVDTGGSFKIYDTIPNSTAPRPFYITGFDDNCARTFTGAVVVTGDAETHEFVRYRPSNERIDYTTTDNAYEALKTRVCRAGRGQPCGERMDRMDRSTHFITVYDFFGGTFSAVPTRWAQILVHDGEVLAMSIKDGQ